MACETNFMPPIGKLSFLFSISQWEAWNFFFHISSNVAMETVPHAPWTNRKNRKNLLPRPLGCMKFISCHKFQCKYGLDWPDEFFCFQTDYDTKRLQKLLFCLAINWLSSQLALLSMDIPRNIHRNIPMLARAFRPKDIPRNDHGKKGKNGASWVERDIPETFRNIQWTSFSQAS